MPKEFTNQQNVAIPTLNNTPTFPSVNAAANDAISSQNSTPASSPAISSQNSESPRPFMPQELNELEVELTAEMYERKVAAAEYLTTKALNVTGPPPPLAPAPAPLKRDDAIPPQKPAKIVKKKNKTVTKKHGGTKPNPHFDTRVLKQLHQSMQDLFFDSTATHPKFSLKNIWQYSKLEHGGHLVGFYDQQNTTSPTKIITMLENIRKLATDAIPAIRQRKHISQATALQEITDILKATKAPLDLSDLSDA